MLSRRRCCGPDKTKCQICTTVKTCYAAPVNGATVTVTQGTTTIGSCTTNGSGYCCVTVPASGTYKVAVSNAGYNPSSTSVTVTCPGTTNVSMVINPTAGASVQFTVNGCTGYALTGATCTITPTSGGPGGGSGVTTSSGVLSFSLGNGTYSWSVSKFGFATQTGTCTVTSCSGCGPITVLLLAASGYVCCIESPLCNDPIPTTLFFTGPLGGVTLTYYSGTSGYCTYTGHGSFSAPAVATNTFCTTSAAGMAGYSVSYTPGQALYYYTALNFGNTMYAQNATGLVCTSNYFGVNTSLCVPAGGGGCPPAYTDSGTVTGGTGLMSVFNGGWTVTQ